MSRSIEVPESVSSDIAPSTDEAILRRASNDFGGIERGSSTGVVHAGSTSDVVRAIRVARSEGMSLTPRAEGLSQSGQAIARNNWTLSLAGLVGVEYTSDLLVTCGAGTSWRQLVHLMAPEGVVPKVLPMNLDISVGGTLSAGGLGASSHRFGPCVANVSALEVVTGEGEVVRCSRTENQDAYDAALAGLGRSVVITSATLELRRNKQAQRTYYLLYDDLIAWLDDQQLLSAEAQSGGRAQYLEAFCSPSPHGFTGSDMVRDPLTHWSYGLHVTEDIDAAEASTKSVPLGLRHRGVLHVQDEASATFASRYDTRLDLMRSQGKWQLAHPWFECLLPVATLKSLLPSVLESLPMFLREVIRVMMVNDARVPRFFMMPEAPVALLAILPAGLRTSEVEPALEFLRELHDRCLARGGKRYLSGWLPRHDESAWRAHYGASFDAWQNSKARFDPDGVFASTLFAPG